VHGLAEHDFLQIAAISWCQSISYQVLPQRSKRRTELFGKELWLLPRGEMSSFVHFVKVDQVRIRTPSPGFRRSVAFIRKHGDRYGNFDLAVFSALAEEGLRPAFSQ
jgi:hypothetical protein